MISPANLELF
jgi:hypothetical protein